MFVAFYTADEKRKLDQKLRANTPPGFACAGEVPERMEGERELLKTHHMCVKCVSVRKQIFKLGLKMENVCSF